MDQESVNRLKANHIVVAMLSDGRSRICVEGSHELREARDMKAAIWTPEEMARYVEMAVEERHVFRNLKQTFQGTTEFSQ